MNLMRSQLQYYIRRGSLSNSEGIILKEKVNKKAEIEHIKDVLIKPSKKNGGTTAISVKILHHLNPMNNYVKRFYQEIHCILDYLEMWLVTPQLADRIDSLPNLLHVKKP